MIKKDHIVVASKYYNIDEIMILYNLGYRHFGENRVDQILLKKIKLPNDISWHMIGHLQSNKGKLLANQISYLHTLDSLKLANILQKELDQPLNCFIQINLAEIDHKSGVLKENLFQFINEIQNYDKIKVVGFMTMGVLDDENKTDQIFNELNALKEAYHLDGLSIGMTNDYHLALKYQPMFIRLGSYFKDIIKGEK